MTSKQYTVWHLVTGDAINTNAAALRRVLHFFRHTPEFRQKIRYLLFMVKCAGHKSNLCTVIAICGNYHARPIKANEICCNLVRYFKYLVPAYCEEYAANLRRHVVNTLVVSPEQQEPQNTRPDFGLVQLYGEGVFPQQFRKVLNVSVTSLAVAGAAHKTLTEVRGDVYNLLYTSVLVSECHPVVTRFWLFIECCFIMCRAQFLCIPSEVFTTTVVQPKPAQAKKLG